MHRLFTIFIIVAAILTIPVRGAAASHDAHYNDYRGMLDKATGAMREYMNAHPDRTVDSMRRHVLTTLAEGPVAPASALTAPRKKKLTADKVYELGRKSSLVFGKMDHVPHINADSAYSTASAVVLTRDGICATNYHVVCDVVLSGAIGQEVKGDKMRFVMDCDGNFYPVVSVLKVDPVNDWALIKIDPCGRELTPAAVGDDLVPGSTVYCLANPSGAYFHFTDGMVSNNTRTRNKQNGRDRYIMEITADYGVGASGGPIYDDCGNLVGIVSSTLSLYANPQQFRNFQMAYKQTVPVFLFKECFHD